MVDINGSSRDGDRGRWLDASRQPTSNRHPLLLDAYFVRLSHNCFTLSAVAVMRLAT
jgi:hypothetical protein